MQINKAAKFFLILWGVIVGGLLLTQSPGKKEVIELKQEEFAKNNEAIPEEKPAELVKKGETNQKKTEKIKKSDVEQETLPAKIMLDVPFTSQAPFAKWDTYHEEACEEASLLMGAYFLNGKKLTPELAEKEIQALIKFQIEQFGDYRDSDIAQVQKLGQAFYGLEKTTVIYDFSPEEIKRQLSLGKPLIVPAAGRLLGNPNFTSPGPLYHNLILVGYDGDMIIANDPGTRKGQGYRYSLKTLYGAIHDFTGKKEEIEGGRKAMLIIE